MKVTSLCLLSCLLFLSSTNGCQIGYSIKSGLNQLNLLNKRVPIEAVLNDPVVSDQVKHKLRLAQEVREFAEKKLRLKPTNNYTSYVDIKRPYVSWVVQVALADELKYHYFKFPFIGSLPYKGFFSKEEARQEVKKFPPEKFDTYIRGVTAYSTLGWFNDPLLNTMTRYKDHDLVNLIIHEIVHATVYLKNHANFNERLATFIGNLGTEQFYRAKEGENSPTLKTIRDEYEDEKLFSEFFSREFDSLKKWYSDNQGKISPEMKEKRLSELGQTFEQTVLAQMKTKKFIHFRKQKLNNAKILTYRTYDYNLEDFERTFKFFSENFYRFMEFCKALKRSSNPEAEIKSVANEYTKSLGSSD